MEKSFWQKKWEEGDIGFHKSEAHDLLVKHLPKLNLKAAARIFIPLCGKTLDIHWLRAQGFKIAGAELSELAVKELFQELQLEPEIKNLKNLLLYRASGIEIFVGDIFDLEAELLGPVDAVYDRAALVALPYETRVKYAQHLAQITRLAPELLITFDYNQRDMEGPPFSVPEKEISHHYQEFFSIELLESVKLEKVFKGQITAREEIRLLTGK